MKRGDKKRIKVDELNSVSIGKRNILRKKYNTYRSIDISFEEFIFRKKQCCLCDWLYNIHLHHIDRNTFNNHKLNLIGLCGNCHSLIHCNDVINKDIKQKYKILILRQCSIQRRMPSVQERNFLKYDLTSRLCCYSCDKRVKYSYIYCTNCGEKIKKVPTDKNATLLDSSGDKK